MGLSDGRNSFQLGFAVLIQCRRVTDSQPATQPATQTRCRSKYRAYAQVKINTRSVRCVAWVSSNVRYSRLTDFASVIECYAARNLIVSNNTSRTFLSAWWTPSIFLRRWSRWVSSSFIPVSFLHTHINIDIDVDTSLQTIILLSQETATCIETMPI